MNLRNLAVAALLAATATAAQQPFDLDPSFRLPVDEININSVLQRPDGKLIISGQLRFPGVDAPSIGGGLLNQDGSVADHAAPNNPHFISMGTRLTPWGDRFYTGWSEEPCLTKWIILHDWVWVHFWGFGRFSPLFGCVWSHAPHGWSFR